MVDVSGEAADTSRGLGAGGRRASARAWAARRGENRKGDALAVSRLAGIQAAKRTAEWIPLCHPVAFDAVDGDARATPSRGSVAITAEVKGTAKTGYEMEALVAASAAALALYDMCKGADKGIRIERVELVDEERAGRAGAGGGAQLSRRLNPVRGPFARERGDEAEPVAPGKPPEVGPDDAAGEEGLPRVVDGRCRRGPAALRL